MTVTAEERSAIEWLENLEPQERLQHFMAVYPFDGELFQIKHDHETSGRYGCGTCDKSAELVVIE